uniref:DCD domain-containing protein n=1 Tax=Arundo donax TaxID=35708 RepID=A0A0A9EL46_ARUDO
MRHDIPSLSFRQDAASSMAGAIFMSNTVTREQCFQASIFGLPLEYASFVNNVKKEMPLFLFDHTLCKLYGVFEAASDGGLNINKSAFRSIQRSYPAQVRISIIWKCRPLCEDEFFPAIEENYYLPRKFYFDLSYEQVVRLYELFDDRKVERPLHNYSKNECLETKHSSKGTPDKRILTPNARFSDQSDLLIPDISALLRKYSTHTNMHTAVPPSVEVHPITSMPLGTVTFGAQIAPMHSHHDLTDGVSTQISAPCSTRHHQLVGNQLHPLPSNYRHKILSSGRIIQDPSEGANFVANQSHPLSHGYVHSSLVPSGYVTQNPTYRDGNHASSTSTPYAASYPHLSLANPQGNAEYQEHCDICIKQCRVSAHDEMYAYERQRFSEGKALPPAKLSQQGVPPYPQVPKYGGNTVSTIDQQKQCFTDYIPIPDYDEGFGNDQMKHGIHSNASDSSDLDNDIELCMSDPRHTKHAIGAERDTNCPQRNVFSRLSWSQQPPSQKAPDPTLDQLVSSLSQKAIQWSNRNGPVADDVEKHLTKEQDTDMPYSNPELNLPTQLESEVGEGIDPQPPFLNFKRRSEAHKVDTNLVKEISGKVKKRKLVRPSFGENNASSAGKEVEGNHMQEWKHNHLEVGGNHVDIDLNVPASVDSDPAEEDNSRVLNKTGREKLGEVDASKPNCSNLIEAIKEQDPSFDHGAPAQKISVDFNVAELSTMDESKLQMILGQTSLLLQALGKLTSGKPNNSEEARSSICGEL